MKYVGPLFRNTSIFQVAKQNLLQNPLSYPMKGLLSHIKQDFGQILE